MLLRPNVYRVSTNPMHFTIIPNNFPAGTNLENCPWYLREEDRVTFNYDDVVSTGALP
jgi:hypothetical protein